MPTDDTERQLPLFGDASSGETTKEADGPALRGRLEQEHAAAAELAARLPASVRFGTSSWTFPGWAGIVWSRRASVSWLARNGLAEYARHPLLRTVGIDRGFYAPIPEADLSAYAGSLPEGFPCCAKAPEAVTSRTELGTGRAGRPRQNPNYLDPKRFAQEMVDPFLRLLGPRTGPFIIQFPPAPRIERSSPEEFAHDLDGFLARLPRDARYAVELRDPTLLGAAYRDVLARHGVAHVYNYASAMPSIRRQLELVPFTGTSFVLIRLLMRRGSRYAERREAFAPFDRIVDPDPEMRRGVVSLVRAATASGRSSFVLVNNKAEGSAPLSIRALAESLAAS